MDLVTKYKKYTDMVPDSTLKLIFRKLSLVKFQFSIKEEYPQLSEKTIKILFPLPATTLCEARFSSYTSTKTTYYNRLKAELDMRIQLSSIKLYIKEICKTVKKKK